MTTRAIMLAEMADDMERTDTAAFASKISAAIRHYQPMRFYFNESRSVTFPTVAATTTYSWTTIGTEFYRIDGAFITEGTNVLELAPAHYTQFETPIASSARPTAFARLGDGVILWCSPDAIYTVRLDGHIKAAEPATDATVGNPWMVEAYDLIMARAKGELYAHRYEDPNNAAIMQQAEASALKELRRATTSKVGTGQLVPTQF
jgi:hypothetical protein